uniref:interleukin-37-like isoform X2 n=1 Tax=Ictidomys tridecemlineatus TaxID=43179 RepID=UPI001A9E6BC9|nr:interleukin-37-like isoform X2 [Ictidomys tridecemlineatus]
MLTWSCLLSRHPLFLFSAGAMFALSGISEVDTNRGSCKDQDESQPGSEEIFYIATSKETSSISSGSTTEANHIFLAVCKGKLCLCCDKVKEPKCPLLELKNKNISELNSLDEEYSLPFTFIQEMVGSYFTLESAANPGCFICTSKTPMQPVGMTKEPGKENNTQFKFQIANADLNSTHSG